MSRVSLTDGSGWFSTKTSILFKESNRWNGNNHISRATGSQWDHEGLYYTKSGRWVLNHWSDWQGSLETYEEIDEADAVSWLVRNELTESDDLEQLPKSIQESIEAAIDAVEV